jgi:hypothetical protein
MPFQDGTGPQGQGSRTGRGQGNCAGQGGTGRGRGLGRGRGAGRGIGRGRGGVSTTQDTSWLETQLTNLQTAIEKLSEKIGQNK